MLSFGARDEHLASDLEVEAEKLLLPEDVLGGFVECSAIDPASIEGELFGFQKIVVVSQYPGAVFT
jgi:hypothetical protein